MKRIFKSIGISLVSVIALLSIAYLFLPKGPRDPMPFQGLTQTEKKLFTATKYAAVTGTPWATKAAIDILEKGGNACDAAVSALLALNVTHGEASSFPGVAPLIYYNSKTKKVKSYIGVGKAPKVATIQKFKDRGFKTVPVMDIWSQLVPASPDVIHSLLQECGSKPFSELMAPAIQLAKEGFPFHALMVRNLNLSVIKRLGFTILLPYNSEVYLKKEWWRPVHLGDRFVQTDLANTLQELSDAADQESDLKAGYLAARNYFYKGPIAKKIADFHLEKGGLITYDDLSTYSSRWEEPVVGHYKNYTIYGNGSWSQGPLEPLILQILETQDLKSLSHNSAQYIHKVTQAIELAMADREAYLGDPDFVNLPIDTLLSKQYAKKRSKLMTNRAFPNLPPAGKIEGFATNLKQVTFNHFNNMKLIDQFKNSIDLQNGQDTSQVAVIDADGNSVVITPSDFPQTPMIPGTGLNLGNRMNQFHLDENHPSSLQPGKRPRITPHSLIIFKDGHYFMSISTPGGDVQSQAIVQVLLNLIIFNMDIQQAISAPRFYSISAPSAFAPHKFTPAGLRLESDLFTQSADQLALLGYQLEQDPKWDKDYGAVGAILRTDDGKILVAADPREETLADGK